MSLLCHSRQTNTIDSCNLSDIFPVYIVATTFDSLVVNDLKISQNGRNNLIFLDCESGDETLLTDIQDGVLCHLLRGSGEAVEWRLEVRVCVYLGN